MRSQSRTCVIIGAGDFNGFNFSYDKTETLYIAADGGYEYLTGAGINPEVWIGDADSIGTDINIDPSCRKIKLPVMKDDTDTFSAVKYGLEIGCEEFHIYGGLGGRLDHTIANIRVISYLTSIGKRAFLFGPGQVLTALQDGNISFSAGERGIISVFSLTDKSEKVTIKGLKYETENMTMLATDSIGVSNEFTGKKAEVSVKGGRLLLAMEAIKEMPEFG